MRRLRAFAYSLLVALAVFLYLALPTLRALYGQVVELPVYALVALAAGWIVWALLADSRGRTTNHGVPTDQADAEETEPDSEGAEPDVEEELATIKDET